MIVEREIILIILLVVSLVIWVYLKDRETKYRIYMRWITNNLF